MWRNSIVGLVSGIAELRVSALRFDLWLLLGVFLSHSLLCEEIVDPSGAFPLGEVTKRDAVGRTKMSYHVAMPELVKEEGMAPLLVLFSPRGDGRRILEPVAPAANRYGWITVGVDRLRNGAMDTRLMIRMENEVLEDVLSSV